MCFKQGDLVAIDPITAILSIDVGMRSDPRIERAIEAVKKDVVYGRRS